MMSNVAISKIKSIRNPAKVNKAFIAAPMSGFGSDHEYKESRKIVLSLVEHLCSKYGASDENIYYAGKSISSQSEFDDATLALEADLGALDASEIFILYYPRKIASSVLVEAGYALARKKPMLLLPKNAGDLPYFFKQAHDASRKGRIPIVEICEYGEEKNILKNIDSALNEILFRL